MTMATQHDDIDMNSPEMKWALAQILLETDTDTCPTTDDLTDFTLRILPKEKQDSVQTHLPECPLCASTAINLKKAFVPVIALQRGWNGWRGPVLAAAGRLPETEMRAWRDLCIRHEPTRQRTETAERMLNVFRPTSLFASGMACMLLLFIIIGRPPWRPNPVGDPGLIITPKGNEGDPDVPVAGFEGALELGVYPRQENIPYVSQYWKNIAGRHPNDWLLQEMLARAATQHALAESDPKIKSDWEVIARNASTKAAELRGQIKP